MSRTSKHHHELNEHGIGKCSVPMWCGGMPADFCDRPAYGEPPKCEMYRDGYTGELRRADFRYNGYVPGLACTHHGGDGPTLKMDGNMWCATTSKFVNLQESIAGFGETKELAEADLLRQAAEPVGAAP